MRIISKSIADSQFFSNNSFTYFWESFHMVNFRPIANYLPTQNEYMLIICKSIADTQFLSNNSFIYLWESFHMVKFQTHS